jgi:hypothetical protein
MGRNPTNTGGRNGAGAYSTAGTVDTEAGAAAGAGKNGAGGDAAGALDPVSTETVGLEHLGLVAGESDPSRLIAEAEAASATAPVDALDPSATPAQELNPNGQWSTLTPPLVEVVCGVVLPAWEIRKEDEQGPISEALAECLEQLFPGGIEGQYACWVRLVFACGAITVSRVAQHGRLPPLFLPKAKSTKPAPSAPTPPPAPAPNFATSLTE